MNGIKYRNGLGLPRELVALDGWFRSVFMVVRCLLLALSLVGAIQGAWKDFRPGYSTSSATQLVGIMIGDAQWQTVHLILGDEAIRSGLHPGDRLVAIDGEPVGADRQTIDAQLAGPISGSVMIDARSRLGQLSRHRLTRNPLHRQQALEAMGGGFNRWMQHTESCHGSRSVADAPTKADLLLRATEVVDVGSLAARRIAAADCRLVRSAQFRYRRGLGAVRRHSSTTTASLTTGVATSRARGDIAWCGCREVDSFDCGC